MAERPVFCPQSAGDEDALVHAVTITFEWTPGVAAVQKQKNVTALHEAAARDYDLSHLLEVSTKASDRFGRRLSAFNMKIKTGNRELGAITVESAYQGSKVFEDGGPYQDLYGRGSLSAKKDERLNESGALTGFRYFDKDWGLLPKTAFYDWLYVSALASSQLDLTVLRDYEGFTDIEFNPKKSLNCQARACALYVALVRRGILDDALESQESFIKLAGAKALEREPRSEPAQRELF